MLTRGGDTGADGPLLTPAAFAGGLLLVVGPWLWRTRRSATPSGRGASAPRSAPRSPRACTTRCSRRSRSSSAKPTTRSASPQLARRQERELRGWLYPEGQLFQEDTLVAAIGNAAAEVEELHGVKVEVASAGNAPLDDDARAVVLAAREAMANAARFSGADEVSVYAEADPTRSTSSSATAAQASTGAQCPPNAAGSPSRSRAAWRGTEGRRP